MAEVLAEFADLIVADGVRYHARACGAATADGTWQGWVEFVPLDGEPPIRSRRETTQPNRTDTIYWATGLTAVYLEGALLRSLNPAPMRRETVAVDRPAFDGPAPSLSAPPSDIRGRDAVLDPFAVYQSDGEALLRRRLAALAAWHLVTIVQQYDLSDEPADTLRQLSAVALVERIMAAVRVKEIRASRRLSR